MTPESAATSALATALAAVQAKLPEIRKSETAEVKTKQGGTYKYNYADLAAISKAILPLLAANGLVWITKPTVNADGRMVLVYTLRHVSGEEESGAYPLNGGTPQEIGSAITYARRYCLCSVTGVAPDSDDDDAAAASRRPQRDEWEAAKPRPQRIEHSRERIFAKAHDAIVAATDRAVLDVLDVRVTEREREGKITADDAITLRRQIVARLDELYPDATPGAVDVGIGYPDDTWPEPSQVPS